MKPLQHTRKAKRNRWILIAYELKDIHTMIVTDINHMEHQVSKTAFFKKAIEFLRRPDIHNMADGRVDIDGQDVFALVQRYETVMADALKFEYHRKYIDIQYIVSGKEAIGWVPAGQMTITEAYDTEKDICFGIAPKKEITMVRLQAGQLAVFYPEDGHAPKLAAGKPSRVVKVVVKVAAKKNLKLDPIPFNMLSCPPCTSTS